MHCDVDQIAESLISWGRLARAMPPAWDGAAIAHPVRGPEGQWLGRMLPGRGLYCDLDLKSVGITKKLPSVFERTPVRRALEALERPDLVDRAAAGLLALASGGVIGAITTYDGIISSRAGGKANDIAFSKSSATTVANAWHSLFAIGGFPAAGTFTNIPNGAVMTRASTGALSTGLTNPSGGDKKYLLTFGYTAAQQIQMGILADLLVAAGNIQSNVNTAQTVTTAALTRYTSGAGVLMTLEVTTVQGATAQNVTVSYTNQAGTAGQSTGAQAMTASAAVGRLQPLTIGPFFPLQSGDYGVQTTASVTFSAANTGGVTALELYYPLCFVPGVNANVYIERDSTTQIDGLTELVQDGSAVIGCLNLYVLPNTTSTGILTGFVRSCAG